MAAKKMQSFTAPQEILDQLKALSEETGLSQAKIIEMALKELFKRKPKISFTFADDEN